MANTKPVTARVERRLIVLAGLGLGLPGDATDSQIIRAALIFASGTDPNPTGVVSRANRTWWDHSTGRVYHEADRHTS